MNQKGVIYIILSAILLYLYYRNRDLAIFAGFAVVVVGTLILGRGGEEGFGMGGGKKGGGGGIDKECAKMGFKQPKIDKKDINGSLEKAMKNIEKVAETKWPFEKGDIEGKRTEDKTVEVNWKVISDSTFLKDLGKEINDALTAKKEHKEYDAMMGLWGPAEQLYKAFIIQKKTDEEKSEVVEKQKVKLDKIIEGGPIIIELINKLKKSDEIKEADDGVKDMLKYITCLVKQWISIITGIKKATADDEGGGDDDDEKPKKKKKTKKKPVDEDEADGEDEKPKKKTKKKSADEDDGEAEKPKKKKKKKSADEDE